MTNTHNKHHPGPSAIVRYYESLLPEFDKYRLKVTASYDGFMVQDKSDKIIYESKTIEGLDGFLRGITFERLTESKLFKGSIKE